MSSGTAVKDARIRQLTAAARELFAKKGFEKTSMEDVARRSGCAVGSMYYHIKSKEELCAHIIIEAASALPQKLQTLITGDLATDSYRLAAACLDYHRDNHIYYEIIHQAEAGQRRGVVSPELMEEIIVLKRQAMEVYAGLLRQHKEAGTLRRDVDEMEITAVLWAWLHGIATSDSFHLESVAGLGVEDLIRTSLELVLAGITRGEDMPKGGGTRG